MNPLDAERASLNNASGRRSAADPVDRNKPIVPTGKPLEAVRRNEGGTSDAAPNQ